MSTAHLTHDEAWLLEQISMMRDWYDSMLSRDAGDTRLADAIARHLAWLETQVRELAFRTSS